ncbi:ATP-binding protein [Streptomyces monticola]|uniref:ATP-binding protein n=1 Tax=Streptomyces monticola TaxID=2666263 RepID=A0ABW2JCC8_9ACTN
MTFGLIRRRPGELPVEVTGFVGRTEDVARLDTTLRNARMVTVTGPGGVGKTRIALRTAARITDRYEHGVCLVELSGLRDPELLPHTVAAALGLPEDGARFPLDAVLDHLRTRRALLILDTCEHLVDACAMLADIVLRETPGISVLATSRQPLDVAGEHTCPVAPLPVQECGGEAVELFAQRAAAVVPGFTVDDSNRADVVRLCRRLDGMPLAIELATVRLRAVPLSQLLDRIEDRFRLLTGGRRTALPRHQTLRTAIEWSHDLCTAQEQLLWARLSVFASSFDLEAAEEVCAGGGLPVEEVLPALVGLVDKSVVLRVDEHGGRYRMLDTLREFGAEHLCASGEEAALREHHCARYLSLAESFDRNFLADDQIQRYRALRREHDDLRLAVEYALAVPGKETQAAALTGALWGYWHISGLHTEGRYWYAKITDRFPGDVRQRAWALAMSSYLGAFQGDPAALDQAQECVRIADKIGDPVTAGRGRVYLNLSLTFTGRHAEAAQAAAEAQQILLSVGDTVGLVTLETQIGYMNHLMGELGSALEVCERGLARLGPDSTEGWVRGYLHYVIGVTHYRRGEHGKSAESGITALRIKHELGDGVGMGYCLELLAWLAVHDGRYEEAVRLLGAADPIWKRAGARLGGTALMEDSHLEAARKAREALGDEPFERLRALGAAQPLSEVVAHATGQVPAPVPEPRGAEPAPRRGSLTRREHEVALLAAEGLSNREIGERLVISKRTVDAHLERILAKLGISARGDIAGVLGAGQG